MIGLECVKNQIRGLRRTMEIVGKTAVVDVPRHIVFVGSPGTGKASVARSLAQMYYEMGAVKTRKVLEKAAGGVLFLREAYTLLPSTARPRGRDHGAAALRELSRTFPTGDPIVILSGLPLDLQRVLSSDIGFKNHFLTRIEFPNPTPEQIARIFMAKLSKLGLVPAEGVTVEYLTELITSNTDPDWRQERNGGIADLLIVGVRSELKKRTVWDDAASKGSLSPMKILSPGSSRMPAFAPEEVFVTVEDVQNSIVNF